MRAVRFVLTLFIAGSLAMLPISAGMAMSQASHAAMNMSASPDGGGDPCCDPVGADACPLATCCHIAALVVEAPALARPVVTPTAVPLPGDVPRTALGPDPPPPRS